MTGLVSYRAGLSAEAAVARLYTRSGRPVTATRWRGQGGEIDLIARDGAEVIFIEVKQASTHARAAERVSAHQRRRIMTAASEFLAGEPDGQGTAVRFDVALVNGQGHIEIVENAFAA